jgi:hypothetical protein
VTSRRFRLVASPRTSRRRGGGRPGGLRRLGLRVADLLEEGRPLHGRELPAVGPIPEVQPVRTRFGAEMIGLRLGQPVVRSHQLRMDFEHRPAGDDRDLGSGHLRPRDGRPALHRKVGLPSVVERTGVGRLEQPQELRAPLRLGPERLVDPVDERGRRARRRDRPGQLLVDLPTLDPERLAHGQHLVRMNRRPTEDHGRPVRRLHSGPKHRRGLEQPPHGRSREVPVEGRRAQILHEGDRRAPVHHRLVRHESSRPGVAARGSSTTRRLPAQYRMFPRM